MTTIPTTNTGSDTRSAWIEPELTVLQISETAANPRTGNDGNIGFPDCTRS